MSEITGLPPHAFRSFSFSGVCGAGRNEKNDDPEPHKPG
jgi:hypothetical protein